MTKQYCMASPDVEVVLVLDEPSDEQRIVEAVKTEFTQYKFRVMVNDQDHEWRNPAKALNVGIRNSIGEYIAVVSPESIVMLPHRTYLQELVAKTAGDWFLTGHFNGILTSWVPKIDEFGPEYKKLYDYRYIGMNYGFILAPRSRFELVKGYNEHFTRACGEDDDIRARLRTAGFQKIYDNNIRVMHGEHSRVPRQWLSGKPPDWQPGDNWGIDFKRVGYDWRNVNG